MFVTIWFGILTISSGLLEASNAGHEYPAIRRANGTFELFKDKHGLAIGCMENMKYQDYEMQLQVANQYAHLEMNFKDLAYISSAGLRTLLTLQKQVNRTGGTLCLTHVQPSVKEVFEITGFAGILTIKD